MVLTAVLRAYADKGIRIAFMRWGPRALDDDNLRASLKAIRDGVADALGIDDGDPRITWEYAQERRKAYGVRIRIEAIT
jgi:hypothetical protein